MVGRTSRRDKSVRKGSATHTRKRDEKTEEEDSASDNESPRKIQRKAVSAHPSSFQMAAGISNTATDISSIHNGESVSNIIDQERWRLMEKRMRKMEDKVGGGGGEGGASVVSGATVAPPPNERLLKENLRKFVAAKVFPNWKFIFKKEKLGLCVISAISKSYISVPTGFEDNQLADLYSPTVRAGLDGGRANAQTTARKRYLSE